jgi:type IV secretory pathway VirB10-like protein
MLHMCRIFPPLPPQTKQEPADAASKTPQPADASERSGINETAVGSATAADEDGGGEEDADEEEDDGDEDDGEEAGGEKANKGKDKDKDKGKDAKGPKKVKVASFKDILIEVRDYIRYKNEPCFPLIRLYI